MEDLILQSLAVFFLLHNFVIIHKNSLLCF